MQPLAEIAEITFFSFPLCAPSRLSHRSDASASRQRHASEEQQPSGHHRGLCGSRHRGGGGGGGADLYAAFLRSAEKVGCKLPRCFTSGHNLMLLTSPVNSHGFSFSLTACHVLVQEEGEPQHQQKKRQPEGPEAS